MTEPRLYIEDDLTDDGSLSLPKDQAHYLRNVLRCGPGDTLKLFNGRDGEWRAALTRVSKSAAEIRVIEHLKPQAVEPDLWLLFAPIKGKRNEAIAEKAGELGASVIQPVMTARTVVSRVNTDRLQANALEAAEQCERLTLPAVRPPLPLTTIMAEWPADRRLLFADERAEARPIATALADGSPDEPWAVLIGPEGGFAPEEQAFVRSMKQAVPVSLGPRLLRADTAVFAALSIWQAHLGDWRFGDAGQT